MLDRFITGFFVAVFGVLWVFTTKYYVMPTNFKIIIQNNNERRLVNEIRTEFNTKEAALSYMEEYKKIFPEYSFTLDLTSLNVRKRWVSKVLRN